MLLNSTRSDQFQFYLPTDIIYEDIAERYQNTFILQPTQMITNIFDLLYDSVQSIDLMPMNAPLVTQNKVVHSTVNGNSLAVPVFYRGAKDIHAAIDKRITITFRLTSGFINYFALLETYFKYHNDKSTPGYFQDMHFIAKYNKQPIYGIDFTGCLFAAISNLRLDATSRDYSEMTFTTTWVFNDIAFRMPSDIIKQ